MSGRVDVASNTRLVVALTVRDAVEPPLNREVRITVSHAMDDVIYGSVNSPLYSVLDEELGP